MKEIESIQLLNNAEGGPDRLPELSPDISCQHFITVAVIKRWRPRHWPRTPKLHLGCRDKAPKQQQLHRRSPRHQLSSRSLSTSQWEGEWLTRFLCFSHWSNVMWSFYSLQSISCSVRTNCCNLLKTINVNINFNPSFYPESSLFQLCYFHTVQRLFSHL